MSKRNISRVLLVILALALMVTSFAGCGKEEKPAASDDTVTTSTTDTGADDVAATKEIRVGTSNVCAQIPESYEKGPMSIEDTDLGQVAYYHAKNELMDFDLYYWAKATDETIDSAIAEETDSEIQKAAFNGIDFLWYDDTEKSTDGEFPTKTYVMEDGDYFVEFVFWVDGDDAEQQIENILNTVEIKANEAKTGENLLQLGTSDLYITTDKAFVKGEVSREDTDLCQVGYYRSDDTDLDFDVYYWAKGDGETLESTAALEADEFGAEISDATINGITVKYYTTSEEFDGETFNTLTYIIDDGDYLAEIVFWINGDTAAEAEAIINTLSK